MHKNAEQIKNLYISHLHIILVPLNSNTELLWNQMKQMRYRIWELTHYIADVRLQLGHQAVMSEEGVVSMRLESPGWGHIAIALSVHT